MGSFLCLPARGAFLRSSSLLHFLSSRTDECTGNVGPGSIEYSATTGRLGLSLLGLEVEALGSGALLARDHDNQLFLGLGRRRVRAETARRMFDRLDSGDNGRDSLVDGSSLARDVGGSKIPRIRIIHIVLCEFIPRIRIIHIVLCEFIQDRTSRN
jgi:hypothetical protein